MSDETPVTLPSLRSQYLAVAVMLVCAVLGIVALTVLGAYKEASKCPSPSGNAAPVELEPTAEPEYVPALPRHVCPTCPYRHYPAVAPVTRPFPVTCPFCRNLLLATPPLGQLGDTVEPPQ